MPPKKLRCAHSIPLALRANLANVRICPPCLVDQHIAAIKDVQKGLKTRGGIFKSKQKVYDELEVDPNAQQQAKRHRAWIRKWRFEKIEVERLVMEWEGLLEHHKVSIDGSVNAEAAAATGMDSRGLEMVEAALKKWNDVKESLAKVPGYVYAEEQESEEESETDSDDEGYMFGKGKASKYKEKEDRGQSSRGEEASEPVEQATLEAVQGKNAKVDEFWC